MRIQEKLREDDVLIRVVGVNDEVKVTVENPSAELIYTKSNYGRKRNFKVYPYTLLNNTILLLSSIFFNNVSNNNSFLTVSNSLLSGAFSIGVVIPYLIYKLIHKVFLMA